MNIRKKWLRDICSIIFSLYYIIFANEADEKVRLQLHNSCSRLQLQPQLRKFRAAPTVEMLRVTWEKTTNPIV